MAKNKIYPYAVARIRMLENSLLSQKNYEQLVESKSAAEVFKILSEAGYGGENSINEKNYEEALSNRLSKAYSDVVELVPDENFMDVFLLKNDYHNLKVLVKSEISGKDGSAFLVDGGTVSLEAMREAFASKNYSALHGYMAEAIGKAQDEYAKTQSGQSIDIVMDNYTFKDMVDTAKKCGNEYVSQYVNYLIDMTNLKDYLRVRNMKKGTSVFSSVYIHDGSISEDTFLKAFGGDNPAAGLKNCGYDALCEKMTDGFTAFEKNCDDFMMAFIKDAKYKSLTMEPMVAYIYAVEMEVKTVRIIISGKINGIDTDVIRERLRDAYV
ncbi:MAG: V-type ATP synthase subunit C [Clostridia bacterium]|jgi:V/A-type H+-transporting ATPase subunit C|nr:V-type ATP synthase subunit C [Clostridia bacterium]